ncbi:MAG: A/G-specific adenine glycosylase [Chloroflexota bacterium]
MPVPPDPDRAVPPALRDAVLAWYEATGRSLAFRATRDPYAVLVSELMAQQTQAARAAAAWTAWMARWPTAADVAAATLADVLRAWAGLGYNRRAVHLHRAAQAIVTEHGGVVPDTVEGLASLPGVGPYTARAVAAIAFGRPVGAVDTNVRRVLGRVVEGGAGALAPAALQALADAAVPAGRAGDWTHALMDLGARLCRPRAPRCADCPAIAWCRYAAGDRPSASPDSASPAAASAGRPPRPPFASTTRWLRGRILARARDAEDGEWIPYREPIGGHDAAAVREAVAALASEGLLEARDTADGPDARLPA